MVVVVEAVLVVLPPEQPMMRTTEMEVAKRRLIRGRAIGVLIEGMVLCVLHNHRAASKGPVKRCVTCVATADCDKGITGSENTNAKGREMVPGPSW